MRSKGFTLVEILVVMLIIAAVISLTVLSVNSTGRDSQLDEESRRIEGLVGWLLMDQEREFRHRELPKGIGFQLQLDSQTVVIKPIDRNLTNGDPPGPQVAIAASGEGTPFRLILLREATQAKAVVDGDAMGKVSRESSNKVEKRS